MKLENRTLYPAVLARTPIDDERFMASVVARVTYVVTPAGALVEAEEPIWGVDTAPIETPHGTLEAEFPFRRGGVDVFLFGTAWAPQRRPTAAMEVRVEIGTWQRRVLVVGDRVWQRRAGTLVASDPTPFVQMPLVAERCYGGKARWDGADIVFGDNPQGRGFYVEESAATGSPLPNLELFERRIQRWDEQSEPACLGLCAQTNGLRVRNSLDIDPATSQIRQLRPTAFNAAYPGMIAPAVDVATPVQVLGVAPDKPLSFTLPPCPMVVELSFDDEVAARPPFIDQIGIEADERRVFITWRYPFRYVLYPKQRRACVLRRSS